MTKEEVFKKAEIILINRANNKRHISTCVEAGICPECGEPLVEDIEDYKTITKCSKDKSHYSDIEYDDWDEN